MLVVMLNAHLSVDVDMHQTEWNCGIGKEDSFQTKQSEEQGPKITVRPWHGDAASFLHRLKQAPSLVENLRSTA